MKSRTDLKIDLRDPNRTDLKLKNDLKNCNRSSGRLKQDQWEHRASKIEPKPPEKLEARPLLSSVPFESYKS